jgi:cytochrome c553
MLSYSSAFLRIVLLSSACVGLSGAMHFPRPQSTQEASPSTTASSTVMLPIEVMGANGTTNSVQVTVPSTANLSGNLRLQMQIHGLEYQNQASIKVNSSAWIPINNSNVQLQGLGGNYGGIGGGFSTLNMTVALPTGTVLLGTNTVSFQFVATDGNSSGFRVLSFNFLANNGYPILPSSEFTQDNPAKWAPPSTAASDIAAGKLLYQTANISQPVPGSSAKSLQAHCGDCHTQDGRDLKYFNYSNNSIYQRGLFHGLNSTQSNQIVSYIRSLTTPAPSQARPWNPPYQPGPGLDSRPVSQWAAGAGLGAVLSSDAAMLKYLAPNGSTAGWAASQTLSARNIPISVQLLDWNHWLPRIHPIDSVGSSFATSQYNNLYSRVRGELVPNDPAAYANTLEDLVNWDVAHDNFMVPLEQSISDWDLNNARTVVYSASEWMMVKEWEINQEFGLEGMAATAYGAKAESTRSWYRPPAFGTSPNMLHIPPGVGLGNGLPVTQKYLAFIWYHLQLMLDPGNGEEHDHNPIDFPYVYGFIKDISNAAVTPNAMLHLEWAVKGLQEETAHGQSPEIGAEGWYWDASDPEELVDPNWAGVWLNTSSSVRSTTTTAFVAAWLAQASSYTPQDYYVGQYASPTENPATMNSITTLGGAMWWMLPRLRYYKIDPSVVSSYYSWVESMWPSANWSLNQSATCWQNGIQSVCSTD